jgi:hypothetical protein
LAHLGTVKQLIPECHSVHENFCPVPVERHWLDWSIQCVYANKPAPTRSTVAAGVFIEAWKRTTTNPQIEKALWARLKAFRIREGQTPGGWENFLERASLWRLNRQIQRQGLRARLINSANLALARGKQGLARKLIYSCLLQNISSAGDLVWIKMLLKSHLSSTWIRQFKRILGGKA